MSGKPNGDGSLLPLSLHAGSTGVTDPIERAWVMLGSLLTIGPGTLPSARQPFEEEQTGALRSPKTEVSDPDSALLDVSGALWIAWVAVAVGTGLGAGRTGVTSTTSSSESSE